MTESQPRKCYCRCGQTVKKNYAPGHDARHVAQVARRVEIVMLDVSLGKRPSHDLITIVESAIGVMPTSALQRKMAARLSRFGWVVFGRQAKDLGEYHREGLARYGSSGTGTAWSRTFRYYRVSDLCHTDDEYFGLLVAAGWDRHSAALAAS